MNVNTTALETNPVKALLRSDAYQKRFQEVLKERTPQFLASLTSLAASSHSMKECKPESIIAAAYICATLDLPVDKNLGFAWIVPYKQIAQFQMGYKGYVQLAIRTGQYRTIGAAAIPEGVFKRWDPLRRTLDLDWDARKSDKTVGYAAYFALVNGYEQAEYWSVEEVEKHAQRYSQAYKQKKQDSPWFTNFDSMGKKTVLKSLLSHYAILSIEMQKAVIHDQGSSIDIDSEVVHPDLPEIGEGEDSPPPAKKVTKLQAAKEKMAAEKKASEPESGGPVDTLEDELSELKEQIQQELLATGGDENHMRMLCRVASNYQGKYFELSHLKAQRDIQWLKSTLGSIKKANATATQPAEPEKMMREPGEDEGGF